MGLLMGTICAVQLKLGSKRETFVVTVHFALPLDLEDYFAPPAADVESQVAFEIRYSSCGI